MKLSVNLAFSSLFLFFATLANLVIAGPADLQTVINLASELFAVQLVGAQVSLTKIKGLCSSFDLDRLAASGYNVTSIKTVFCSAAHTGFPSLQEVRDFTTQYSTQIWITQAVGALDNDTTKLKGLCDSIDVVAAFSVGLNGTETKNEICTVANGGELPDVPVPLFTVAGSQN